MATYHYLTEIAHGGNIYKITDRVAQKKLQSKADLVSGKVSRGQLPEDLIYSSTLETYKNTVTSNFTQINNQLAGTLTSASLDGYARVSDVTSMFASVTSSAITSADLSSRLQGYVERADLANALNSATGSMYLTRVDASSTYLTIFSASNLYATRSSVSIISSAVLSSASAYTNSAKSSVLSSASSYTSSSIASAGSMILSSANAYTDQKLSSFVPIVSGSGGVSDYNFLQNLPQINGIVVKGELSTDDLQINYSTLQGLPTINGQAIVGDVSLEQLGITSGGSAVVTETDPIWTAEKDKYATITYTQALFAQAQGTTVTKLGPTEIVKPASGSPTITLNIKARPNAIVNGFSTLSETDGAQNFRPLFSEQGILFVQKVNSYNGENAPHLILTLGSDLMNEGWTNGYIYLSQFMDVAAQPDSYVVDETNGTVILTDVNLDQYPQVDSVNGILTLQSDDDYNIEVDTEGVLTISTKS
jgi:hypothetical protein